MGAIAIGDDNGSGGGIRFTPVADAGITDDDIGSVLLNLLFGDGTRAKLSLYNGGDVTDKANYDIIESI